ncbi:MAG: DNA primase, partial [Heliobacteriaceae bacterium]|nr:DNA primase [Heliobacteriaceae bacterium]
YCFGCGTGGDVFNFLMLRENLNFPEALKKLAAQAGVNLPENYLTPAQKVVRTELERGQALHRRASELFFRCLREDPRAQPAREYLQTRGVSEKVAFSFGLGYAPAGWDFLTVRLLAEGFTPEELERFGLVARRTGGEGIYDRFRHRLMFPIFDVRGRPVAFGGRVLDDGAPKYLNSPETPLFKKARHLYGLHKAGPAMREKRLAVLVEGYMDVIACHQQGITQAVASLGTALTREQGRLLLRFAPEVLLAYDNDEAGIKAAVKAGGILTGLGAQVRVLVLSGAKDPDDYLAQNGAARFWLAAEKAQAFFVFRFQQLTTKYDVTTPGGKACLVRELAPDLLAMPSAVEQEANIHWLAGELRLSTGAIVDEVRALARNAKLHFPGNRKENFSHTIHTSVPNAVVSGGSPGSQTAGPAAAGEKTPVDRQEQAWRYLIYWMVADAQRVRRVWEQLGDQVPVTRGVLREILDALVKTSQAVTGPLAAQVAAVLTSVEAKRYFGALLVADLAAVCDEAVVKDCINTIRYGWLLEEISRLEARIDAYTQNGDVEALQLLLPELAGLQKARSRAAGQHGAIPLGGRWEQRPWHKGGTADER